MNIFNTHISLFTPSLFDGRFALGTKPQTVELLFALKAKNQIELIREIRNQPDKSSRDVLKKQLWAITPSAIMKGGRKAEFVQDHSGLMAFDIDNIIDGDIQQYFEIIKQIPYVAYLGLSASGKGLWGLMPIAYPSKHSLHFDAMEDAFKEMGIEIDPAPRAVNSLRFLAYDSEAYFNPEAQVWEKIKEPVKQSQKGAPLNVRNKGTDNSGITGKELGEWFNENCTAADIDEILTNYGFNFHSIKGSHYYYTRPDKDVKAGLSLDYHEYKRTLCNFSSEVPMLHKWKRINNVWACSPLTALLIYGCGGESKEHWATAFKYIKSKM